MDTDQLQEGVLHVRDSFSMGGKLISVYHNDFRNHVLPQTLYYSHRRICCQLLFCLFVSLPSASGRIIWPRTSSSSLLLQCSCISNNSYCSVAQLKISWRLAVNNRRWHIYKRRGIRNIFVYACDDSNTEKSWKMEEKKGLLILTYKSTHYARVSCAMGD